MFPELLSSKLLLSLHFWIPHWPTREPLEDLQSPKRTPGAPRGPSGTMENPEGPLRREAQGRALCARQGYPLLGLWVKHVASMNE